MKMNLIEKKKSMEQSRDLVRKFGEDFGPIAHSPIIRKKNSVSFKKISPVKLFSKRNSVAGIPTNWMSMTNPVVKRKKSRLLFEINEEDRIFDQLIVDKKVKKKKVKKLKIKQTPNEKILNKLYNTSPRLTLAIDRIKKRKNDLSLVDYQSALLHTVSNNLSNESRMRLSNTFTRLKVKVSKRYETNKEYIKEVEKTEEEIIKNINQKEEKFEKILSRNLKYSSYKLRYDSVSLPKIKFNKLFH